MTVIDHLTARLNGIIATLSNGPAHSELESELATLAELLSGLDKIARLLQETFSALDTTLLKAKTEEADQRIRLQDKLATISTVLMNYADVFARIDPATVGMFLGKVSPETLRAAWGDASEETKALWREVIDGDRLDGGG